MSKFKLIVSQVADETMIGHAVFLAQVNEKNAENFIREYSKALKSIMKMPASFPDFNEPEIEDGYKKSLFFGRYLILFKVVEDLIYVDYVVDCKQNRTLLT